MEIEFEDYQSMASKGKLKNILDIHKLNSRDAMKIRIATTFKHGVKGKSYSKPRIILDSTFKDLLGKCYVVFQGEATYREEIVEKEEKEVKKMEGQCVVLFFSDDLKQGETALL